MAAPAVASSADPFSEEQLRRGGATSDLLRFAEELPHRWPGDDLAFPCALWDGKP